ncbi:MAG: hypothetical protein JNN01_20815 [Opitutaceae bacterium]|nr:hypothetical protein [Opitutaceae bacterium]
MISSLRHRHRLIWHVLPLVIAGAMVVAWVHRRAPAVMERLPEVLQGRSKP